MPLKVILILPYSRGLPQTFGEHGLQSFARAGHHHALAAANVQVLKTASFTSKLDLSPGLHRQSVGGEQVRLCPHRMRHLAPCASVQPPAGAKAIIGHCVCHGCHAAVDC